MLDARPAVAPPPTPSGDIEFRAAVDLGQTPGPGNVELRGGREAVSAEWPASLYATFTAHGSTAACTAALLGPSVMLTAAHCVPDSGNVTFTYDGHGGHYAATCARHPDYESPVPDPSADFALCTISPAFEAPAGFKFETVNTAEMSAQMDRPVVLTGFGCVSSVAPGASFDGKYRIGFDVIDESSVSSARSHGADFYAPIERNNLFTKIDPDRTNPCVGESGGPVFAPAANGAGLDARTIIGVNSRVFYRDGSRTAYASSLISATGGPAFRTWAGQWTRRTGAAACGVAGTLSNCRN